MRRTAILSALVLCCAPLSACGKGGYAGNAPRSPGAVRTSRGAITSASPTHAQALAFAHAVNLTAADVPGFTATPSEHNETAIERRLKPELLSCAGAQGSRALLGAQSTLVEASSPNFELHRGILDLTVGSEVSVDKTSAEAAATLQAVHSAHLRACFTRYLSRLLKSQQHGGAVTGVSIASGTPPAPGTTGGFGWRVTATLSIRGIRLSFYLDILGFVYGPSQVTLSSSSVVRPFPASAQEKLFSTLLTRARAHGL